MKIGVSGHQSRPGLDWNWVGARLDGWLQKLPSTTSGYSCLAAGADQVFAQAVLKRGFSLTAIVPFDGYERTFSSRQDLDTFNKLIAESRVHELHLNGINSEIAFMKASEHLVDSVDLVVFIWDGLPAESFGGTADVVSYAVKKGKRRAYLNPIDKAQEGDWI